MWTTLTPILKQIWATKVEIKAMGSPGYCFVKIFEVHPEYFFSEKSKDQYVNYIETNSGTNQINTGRENGHGHPRGLRCKNLWGAVIIFFSAKSIDQYVNYFETNSGTNLSNTGREKGQGQPRGLPCKNLWVALWIFFFGQIDRSIFELLWEQFWNKSEQHRPTKRPWAAHGITL